MDKKELCAHLLTHVEDSLELCELVSTPDLYQYNHNVLVRAIARFLKATYNKDDELAKDE